jgi:hypothetical protein
MSEEEATAIIEERIDEIVARMASGTSNVSMAGRDNVSGTGNQPCGGDCPDPVAEPGQCCSCCLC